MTSDDAMPTLRELREAEGLTQRGLAWRADVSRATVLSLERGHWSGMAVRRKLDKALGVEVDAIDWPASSHARADPEKG